MDGPKVESNHDKNPAIVHALEAVLKETKISDLNKVEIETKEALTEVKEIMMPEKKSTLELLIEDLSVNPEKGLELVSTLARITKPWEALSHGVSHQNELVVPPGQSPKEFMKAQETGAFVSGYRLCTIFGEQVAMIVRDNPKWRVSILGEHQPDAPFAHHAQKMEKMVKDFVAQKLRAKGYFVKE